MEKAKKVYLGRAKKKNDTWFKGSINYDELKKHVEEYNGKKYVKVDINITAPDKFGNELSISWDSWKPEAKAAVSNDDSSGLPF
jgi:hypothetical protein